MRVAAIAVGALFAALTERGGEVAAPGVKGRRKTAQQAGSKAGQTGEREQPDIDVGAKGVLGNVVRHEAQEGAHRERREGDSERTTDESEQHALGEQLAANAAPRSTQGKARPDLPAARGSSPAARVGRCCAAPAATAPSASARSPPDSSADGAARSVRRSVSSAEAPGSPTCGRASRACARSWRRRPAAPSSPSPAPTGPRPRPPTSTSAPRRCSTASTAPTSSPSSTSTASCWRRGTEPSSRRWRCSPRRHACSGRAVEAGA